MKPRHGAPLLALAAVMASCQQQPVNSNSASGSMHQTSISPTLEEKWGGIHQEDQIRALANRISVPDLVASAEKGDATAQHNLGVFYEHGIGVRQDYGEAAKWFRAAANQGLAPAQTNLGFAYLNGQGVPQDDREAARWFQAAANQGDAIAENNLGNMYLLGRGLPKDYGAAIKWYRLAAEQGYPPAQSSLGKMYVAGLGVAKDESDGAKWFLRSAQGGDPESQHIVGHMYFAGIEVSPDKREAERWWRAAAIQGYVPAKEDLHTIFSVYGFAYAEGKGVPVNFVRAYMWFKVADNLVPKSGKKLHDIFADLMTSKQIENANQLTRRCITSRYTDCGTEPPLP